MARLIDARRSEGGAEGAVRRAHGQQLEGDGRAEARERLDARKRPERHLDARFGKRPEILLRKVRRIPRDGVDALRVGGHRRDLPRIASFHLNEVVIPDARERRLDRLVHGGGGIGAERRLCDRADDARRAEKEDEKEKERHEQDERKENAPPPSRPRRHIMSHASSYAARRTKRTARFAPFLHTMEHGTS